MNIHFHPVTKERWKDFENLFESKGAPHYCWCMVWRPHKPGLLKDKSEKKQAIHDFVKQNIPIGILGYSGYEPIAWCSIAPRDSYRSFNGYETDKSVWSIACFFIKRAYRGNRIQTKLIQESIKYARENGAQYIEAYPVEPDAPSYRFMGFKPTFDKANFDFIKKSGKHRNVMIKKL